MANNSYVRSGGAWTGFSRLRAAEMQQIDQAQKRAINGDDGGAWAPATPIQIGGAGLQAPGGFTAGLIGASTPALSVSGAAVSFASSASVAFSSATSGTAFTGTLSPQPNTGKISTPGKSLVINDGACPAFNPPRSFSDVAARASVTCHHPTTFVPEPVLLVNGVYFAPAGRVLTFALTLPPSSILTRLYAWVSYYDRATYNAASTLGAIVPDLALDFASATAQGVEAIIGSLTHDPTTTAGTYNTQHALDVPMPSGGVYVNTAYTYVLRVKPQAYSALVAAPRITGSVYELRVV